MTINEIIEYSKLSKAEFARRYKIPIRTIEDWTSGKKLPRNEYVFELLEKAVIHDTDQLYKLHKQNHSIEI